MLEGFKGVLQTDGYTVYNGIAEQKGIILIHFMTHARRYFVEALDSDRAEYAFNQFRQLYATERNCTEQQLDTDARKQIWWQQSLPTLQSLVYGCWPVRAGIS